MRSSSAVRALEAVLRPKPRVVKCECRRCGNWHTGAYGGCKLCLEIERLRGELWRKGQKKKGLCCACVEKMGRGSVIRCTHHLERSAADKRRYMEEQRAKGLCTFGRCPTPAEGWLCAKHAERRKEYHEASLLRAAARSSRRGLRPASRRA